MDNAADDGDSVVDSSSNTKYARMEGQAGRQGEEVLGYFSLSYLGKSAMEKITLFQDPRWKLPDSITSVLQNDCISFYNTFFYFYYRIATTIAIPPIAGFCLSSCHIFSLLRVSVFVSRSARSRLSFLFICLPIYLPICSCSPARPRLRSSAVALSWRFSFLAAADVLINRISIWRDVVSLLGTVVVRVLIVFVVFSSSVCSVRLVSTRKTDPGLR